MRFQWKPLNYANQIMHKFTHLYAKSMKIAVKYLKHTKIKTIEKLITFLTQYYKQ